MPRLPSVEDHRLEEAKLRKKHWKRWGPYLSSANGAPSVRITARTGPLGSTFPSIIPLRGPIAGGKTVSAASVTGTR